MDTFETGAEKVAYERGYQRGRVDENSLIYHQFAKDLDALIYQLHKQNLSGLEPMIIEQMIKYARRDNQLVELPPRWREPFYSKKYDWAQEGTKYLSEICEHGVKYQVLHDCHRILLNLEEHFQQIEGLGNEPNRECLKMFWLEHLDQLYTAGKLLLGIQLISTLPPDFYRVGLYPLILFATRTIFTEQLLAHFFLTAEENGCFLNTEQKNDLPEIVLEEPLSFQIRLEFEYNEAQKSSAAYFHFPAKYEEINSETDNLNYPITASLLKSKNYQKFQEGSLDIFDICPSFKWKQKIPFSGNGGVNYWKFLASF